jgi:ATP-dependent Clp protease adaptor protein ClpS
MAESGSDTKTVTRDRAKTRTPKLYKVILLNDDYTTMDFVVSILETVFKKSPAEAVRIMLNVHHKGFGVCGVYTKEIAESKIAIVHDRAQASGYPLRCSMEEA